MYTQYKIGDKINYWEIIGKTSTKDKFGKYKWIVKCVCGSTRDKPIAQIKKVKSCGCVNEKISIGSQFGKLKVISFAYSRNNAKWWNCLCDCGKTHITSTNRLTQGSVSSCGCSKLPEFKLGEKIGKLKIIKLTNKRYRKKRLWECKCECGNQCLKSTHDIKRSLLQGINISCGCNFNEVKVGDVYGYWTVESFLRIRKRKDKKGVRIWKCKCKCGNLGEVPSHSLSNGHSKSCGCYHKEVLINLNTLPIFSYLIKKCPLCKKDLPKEKFGKDKTRPGGLKSLCRQCGYKNKDYAKVIVNNYLRTKKIKQATPNWVRKIELENIYRKKEELELELKIKLNVDHILPLINKNFCGLNVPWNLQITTQHFNASKSNKINQKDLQEEGIAKDKNIIIHKSVNQALK